MKNNHQDTEMLQKMMNNYRETIKILELFFEEMFTRNDLTFVFIKDFTPLFRKILHESLVLEWISEDKKADYQFIIDHANEIKKELPIIKLLEAYGDALLKYSKYDSNKEHSRFDNNIFLYEFKSLEKRARDFGVSDEFINEFWGTNKNPEQFFQFYMEDGVLKATAFYKVAYIYPRKYTNYDKYRYINGVYRSFYQYLLFTDAGEKREVILEQMIKRNDISKEALIRSDDISREMYVEASNRDSSCTNIYSKKQEITLEW